jgi:hypothetical protein
MLIPLGLIREQIKTKKSPVQLNETFSYLFGDFSFNAIILLCNKTDSQCKKHEQIESEQTLI